MSKGKHKKSRPERYQIPRRSLRLGEISRLIDEGRFPEALRHVESDLGKETSPGNQAKLLSQVARSLHKRGRFADAATAYGKASKLASDSARDWLAPELSRILALIKNVSLSAAVDAAEQCLAAAQSRCADFTKRQKDAAREFASTGRIIVPRKPHRPCVVATRLGEMFFREGEWEAAKAFLECAVANNPRGGTRARQALAEIALRLDDPETAFQRAVEAITLGKFQAKTVAAWKPLFAAKRKLGQSGLPAEFVAGLRACAPSVRARATLGIVRELRSAGDVQWKDLCIDWLARDGRLFASIAAEFRKLLLADSRRDLGDPAKQLAAARALLEVPNLAPHEWIAGAKEIVRSSFLSGTDPNISALVRRGRRIHGDAFAPQLQHSLALSCMMARRYENARSLLRDAISSAVRGTHVWSKASWALGRMEAHLKNYPEATESFGKIADSTEVPSRFRLQARMLWAENLLASGNEDALRACAESLPEQLAEIQDFETLLDFARQLSRSQGELIALSRKVYTMGEQAAKRSFQTATHPSVALDVLFKLTRRQVYDFGKSDAAIDFWQNLPDAKKLWLWNNDNRWWNYLALILLGYLRLGQTHAATELAKATFDDPSTPREALPAILVPYHEEMLLRGEPPKEALDAFRWIVTENPTRANCATAYYWLALDARRTGDRTEVISLCRALLTANTNTEITYDQWILDAKARLLQAEATGTTFPVEAVEYDVSWIERARSEIEKQSELLGE